MKRIRIAAAALLFSAVLAASGCGVSKEARQDRSAGIVKMNNGEFSGAVESFRAAYNKTGKLSTGFRKDILKYLSEAEFRGGDYQGAADTYDELIRIDGGKPEYWFFRAAAEAGLGNADEARKNFASGREKGNADTPGAEIALSAIASVLEDKGDYDSLSALASDLLGSGWTNPEVYNIQGIVAADQEDDDGAAEAFQKAQEAVKDNTPAQVVAEVRRNQGALAEKQGDFEGALAIFREVLKNYGGDENLKKEIIFLKTRVGDTTEDDFSGIVEEETAESGKEPAESSSAAESTSAAESASAAESTSAAKGTSAAESTSAAKGVSAKAESSGGN